MGEPPGELRNAVRTGKGIGGRDGIARRAPRVRLLGALARSGCLRRAPRERLRLFERHRSRGLNDPDTVRDPDLIFFTESRGLDELSRKGSTRIPAPVVEVQSPTDRYGRILRRIEPYHKRGVPLVWLVDPEERTVTAFTPNEFPKMHDETEQLTGNGVLPGFACRVSELFALPGQPPAPPSESSVPIGKEPT